MLFASTFLIGIFNIAVNQTVRSQGFATRFTSYAVMTHFAVGTFHFMQNLTATLKRTFANRAHACLNISI